MRITSQFFFGFLFMVAVYFAFTKESCASGTCAISPTSVRAAMDGRGSSSAAAVNIPQDISRYQTAQKMDTELRAVEDQRRALGQIKNPPPETIERIGELDLEITSRSQRLDAQTRFERSQRQFVERDAALGGRISGDQQVIDSTVGVTENAMRAGFERNPELYQVYGTRAGKELQAMAENGGPSGMSVDNRFVAFTDASRQYAIAGNATDARRMVQEAMQVRQTEFFRQRGVDLSRVDISSVDDVLFDAWKAEQAVVGREMQGIYRQTIEEARHVPEGLRNLARDYDQYVQGGFRGGLGGNTRGNY